MTRLMMVSGALSASMGTALLIPVMVRGDVSETLSKTALLLVWLGVTLILSGFAAILYGSCLPPSPPIPPPVRAAISGNILFLAFIALEFSDGLVRQGGRTLYWTSVLFLPALLLLYGMILPQRWAWWTARAMGMLFTLWFAGFVVLIPFADLRGSDGPVPWSGRLYMIGVSLVFAGISAYAFCALGSATARAHFGILLRPAPDATQNSDRAATIE
jgi:hypothetical protein